MKPDDVTKARARAVPLNSGGGGGDSLTATVSDIAVTREQRRSRRKREVGKVTELLNRLPQHERRRLALLIPELTPEEVAMRPKTRGDCVDGLRPCPWVGCKHHLFLDVAPTGNLTLRFPDLEPEQLAESCALDVAEHGGETLEAVGELCNITRERVRQIESRAMFTVKARARLTGLDQFADQSAGPRVGARKLTRDGRLSK